ncbi:MAG TPA: M20/M25/M40 family metallo-hydrolase [Terracidiphilus sp.]|nr:M20/M25/M40 family metallo-hydrolase [Terracidiphilus sp.]
MTAAEILRALVAIPTPSVVSNVPLIDWAAAFVEARGWHAQRFAYTDDNGIAKANLIARPASLDPASSIDLAFICHTDTVPYAPSWSRALDLHSSADGRFLHGCGSCDVKSALACFLAALDTGEPITANAALILTADEEIGCKGMDRLLAATQLRIRSAIVSEPTSLRPCIAGKGYGLARIRIEGREAHSAFPREGVSAIHIAARFITRVGDLAHAETDTLFDPAHTTINVGLIEGGTAKNIVPGACSFLVEWRPIPADPPRSVLAELEWLADQIRMEEPHARIHIEPLRAEPGFAPAADGPLLKRLTAIAGQLRTPTGISFGSEASRLARVAQEIIVIGPGDMHTAHSDRECVPLAELEEWTETLRMLLTSN